MPTGSNNLFGLTQYDGATSFFDLGGDHTILSKGVGYGIVCGFGALFAVVCSLLALADIRLLGHLDSSEHFQTASRNIKTGLIADDCVSHWTWSITLLQSSTVAFNYGIAGPFWYSAGAVLQILLFGVMAIQIKRKAPTAHTILEVVRLRWGKAAHIVFMYLFLANNLFITSTLVIGGGAVINALSGVPKDACCILIPVSVLVYCAAGGIKAVFTSSYLHSTIIFVCVVLFSTYTYSGSSGSPIGSIAEIHSNLIVRSQAVPIHSNKEGSAITMWSIDGLEFGFIFFASCFGWIWADQGFWQSAIAARPTAAFKGYILGGLLWFAVPFSLATALGLTALALDLPLSAAEVSAGLVPPAVAYYLFGKAGVVLITIMVFMAVTSSGSAEFLSVSSIFSYDIYKTYIHPKASGRRMLAVSRLAVLGFALFAGVWSIVLVRIGIDINWLFFVIGLLVASVFPPISFLLTWNAVPRGAAITAALGGQAAAIIAWLSSTHILFGEVTIATTALSGPSLAGNLVAIIVSGAICVVWTLVAPDREAGWGKLRDDLRDQVEVLDDSEVVDHEAEDPERMARAYRTTWIWAGTLSVLIFVAWPLLTLPAGVFSEKYFAFWVGLATTWGWAAALVVIFLPLIESRKIFAAALGFGPLARKNKHKTAAAQDVITLDMPPAGKEQLPNGKEGTEPADAGHESPIKV